MDELIYQVQEYKVKYDLGPITIYVTVYHENQTELSKSEILAEALEYLHEANIEVREGDLLEIETITKQ